MGFFRGSLRKLLNSGLSGLLESLRDYLAIEFLVVRLFVCSFLFLFWFSSFWIFFDDSKTHLRFFQDIFISGFLYNLLLFFG